jgi:exosortase
MSASTAKISETGAPRNAALIQALLLLACSAALGWKTLVALVQFSLSHEESSHVIVIPFLSVYILWSERDRIFGARTMATDRRAGFVVMAAGVLAYGAALLWMERAPGSNGFSLQVLCLVTIWIGIFLAVAGSQAWHAAKFALLLLVLMAPLPDAVLSKVVYALEKGSTDITYAIFRILRIPTLRDGFYLTVPGITIEVAPECSGIRSSVAMLITCLLAAHFYLRTWWGWVLFMLVIIPVSMIKNGIRIATLTLLSLYVDPSFLHGSLHRDGGFVFFFLGLVILGAALVGIRKLERRFSNGIGRQQPGLA